LLVANRIFFEHFPVNPCRISDGNKSRYNNLRVNVGCSIPICTYVRGSSRGTDRYNELIVSNALLGIRLRFRDVQKSGSSSACREERTCMVPRYMRGVRSDKKKKINDFVRGEQEIHVRDIYMYYRHRSKRSIELAFDQIPLNGDKSV